jgi:glycosyltransferase involved in cell wall biosynthesis
VQRDRDALATPAASVGGWIIGGETLMRVLFALPGLHRVVRGAEVAFEELAKHISAIPAYQVTLIGSGQPIDGQPYRFKHAGCWPRETFERWPKFPYLRSHYAYEELTFAPALLAAYRPADFDITVTCGYPYTNWVLRSRHHDGCRPKHVFVTQNGDWMVRANNGEYRWFSCDGLVCTNHEYFERNCKRYPSALIPNGVDPTVFFPAPGNRSQFHLPNDAPVALMVSALIPSKRVLEGIRAAARVPDLHLIVAGDGELREQVQALGRELMGERFRNTTLPRAKMPELYRCANVFLHMSQDEPSANVYMEALASGLPIVTHDRPVTRWTLENTATLVDTSDEALVAEAIKDAINKKRAEDVAARRKLVERRFSWSSIARSYCDFFERIAWENAKMNAKTPRRQEKERGSTE